MDDPNYMLTVASFAVVGLSISSAAMLRGWNGWLELKRLELTAQPPGRRYPVSPAARIDLADLRERVRNLEAIASGGDSSTA